MKGLTWKYNLNQKIINDKINVIVKDTELRTYFDSKNHLIRSKFYHLLCSKCNYLYWKEEIRVENSYCPCCINKVVVKGINDISTTHPELLVYFENIEDAYTHTYGSQDYIWVICPICKTRKYMQISHLTAKGIGCQNCSDGISYPEKFIANMLMQMNIDFIRQYSRKHAKWVGYNFYDFYLPSYNMIIEVHGMQHYKQSFSKIKLKDQIAIDNKKRNNAIKNGITYYIEIDARYSDMNYIKTSVLNNKLSEIINLKNIKWELCNEAGCNSIVKEVCEYWKNHDLTPEEVGNHFKLDRCTVGSYLKKGTINGWCDYDSQASLLQSLKNNAPKINYDKVKQVCEYWNTGFTIKELTEKFHMSQPTITNYLKIGNKEKLCNYSIKESKIRASKINKENLSKKVNVYKDGKYIMSEINARVLSEISLEVLGIKLCRSNINAVCKRERKQHHGFVFRYDEDDEFKTN